MVSQKNNQKQTQSFYVGGMTCVSCAATVEKALRGLEGVTYASVNLSTEKGVIVSDSFLAFDKIKKTVEDAGYHAYREKPSSDDIEARYLEMKKRMALSWILTLPLMILMIFHFAGIHPPYFQHAELILGATVIFFIGRKIFKSAWTALSHYHANMDVLISLGSLSAWLTIILYFTPLPISSFGTLGAMIMAIHLTGRYIESYLRDRAGKTIQALTQIQAREALCLIDEKEVTLPIENIATETRVIVRMGERIPLDGKIIDGEGLVDASMISGEPIPKKMKVSDEVIGGTILTNGRLLIEVTRTGEDTFLSQMIQLIEEAQGTKVPIQALADRITNYFVPVVFLLAVIAGISWFIFHESWQPFLQSASEIIPWINPEMGAISTGIFTFIATLVIACPCALGLATPMALVKSAEIAAKRGFIIRNGEVIQYARHLDTIFFDKTGTVTEGHPRVIEHTLSQDDFLIAASMEKHSLHPLAEAIVYYADENYPDKELPASLEAEELIGKGVKGKYQDKEFFIGKPENPDEYQEYLSRGMIIVEFTQNGKKTGHLVISDPIKQTSPGAVAELKKMGITPVLLTGDNTITAHHVAEELGIEKIRAQVSPSEKVHFIKQTQETGRSVAMVGDGINDAAALKSADIGFAVGSGTDLAIDSADVVLIKSDLSTVVDAVRLSHDSFHKIRQNLFWAFFYNSVALPLAVIGFMHPIIAEGAMVFSSINVILNSNRLSHKRFIRKYQLPKLKSTEPVVQS